MSSQERRENSGSLLIDQIDLADLEKDPTFFASLTDLYCLIFNGPPWNENWTDEKVKKHINRQKKFPGKLTVAREGGSLVGFFWGCEGNFEELVPDSVEIYLDSDPLFDKSAREYVTQRVMASMVEMGVDKSPIYWGCEMGIPLHKRNTSIATRLLRKTVAAQVATGNPSPMYGMTATDSGFYQIINKRGARLHYPLSDLIPGDTRVFMSVGLEGFPQ